MEKFVKLPRDLLRSRQYRLMGASARDLYTWMLDSMFDESYGVYNKNPSCVRYGPSFARRVGMTKQRYYRSLEKLISRGVITETEPGSHGRLGVYDLTAWRWKNGD